MRIDTVTTEVYKFDELADDVKAKALDACRSYSVQGDWWDATYEDAATIGIKITSFDLDRSRHATGTLTMSLAESIASVLENHGETCETHKTATNHEAQRVAQQNIINTAPSYDTEAGYKIIEDADAKLDEIETEYLCEMVENYSIMLQKESEYLQSDEAVQENIEANEYEFTADGSQY